MTSKPLRIATRESRLALVQTTMVGEHIHARHGMPVEQVGMTTKGDQVLDRPLAEVGGKGLFVKELEVALEQGRADIAVHSMKDVPMELPPGFTLRTFGPREVPLDAIVSRKYDTLEALPEGAVVGTSSLRRECQLRRAYPKLVFRALRGNVNTRLAKLDRGEYDAIILAAAGLRRLGMGDRIRGILPEGLSVPAIAQGILAIEYRSDRRDLDEIIAAFEDPATDVAARAERALGLVVEGSCDVPVGGYARVNAGEVSLEGFIGMPDGSRMVRETLKGPAAQPEALGRALGERLLGLGGRAILDAIPKRGP